MDKISQKQVLRQISELKPHPVNEEIYGKNEDVSKLVETIKKSGLVTTMTITENNTILSGHRRWKACKELVGGGDSRFNSVNCEVFVSENELEQIEYLIISNDSREKTMEQKGREAQKLLEVEKKLAEMRMKSGIKTDPIPKSGQGSIKGRAGDIVAKKLHMKSGHEVDRIVRSVKKIDELEQQGRKDDSNLIRDTLNNISPSAASDLSSHINDMTQEEKQAIINKETSVNKVLSRFRKPKLPVSPSILNNQEKYSELEKDCAEVLYEFNARSVGMIEDKDTSNSYDLNNFISEFNIIAGQFNSRIMNLTDSVNSFTDEQKNVLKGMIINTENKLKKLKKAMED